MKTYTAFWLNGKAETLQGESEADALNRAGYGRGALGALDFISGRDTADDWEFDKAQHTWVRKR